MNCSFATTTDYLAEGRTARSMEHRRSVLQLGMAWFPEQPGGMDRYYFELVRRLASEGVQCRGMVAGSPQVAVESGGAVVAFERPEAPIWKRWFMARMAARALLRNWPAEVVAAHFALYALPVLGLLGDRGFVVHFHGPWTAEAATRGKGGLSQPLRQWIEQRVYKRADRVIVLSRAFGNLVEREYGVEADRVRVIPGGVETERYWTGASRVEARLQMGWPIDRPIVLAVRRLVERMGLEELIVAARTLRERVKDALVLIAGTGPNRDRLATQISQMRLETHVRLLGFVPDEQLPMAYRAADVTVVPTATLEGFGLVAAESLSAGTPAVVTPVGGLPEVVRDLSEEMICENITADAIADRLRSVLEGKLALPTDERCRQFAAERYDWSVVTDKILEIYQEAANTFHRPF